MEPLSMGLAAASMVNAHMKRQKQLKAAVEDAKLQRAKLEQARSRHAGDYAINTQRAREAAQQREVAIEQGRVNADSAVKETFAGSGISGNSMDELNVEVNAQVAQNKAQNRKALDQQLSDAARNDRQQTQDINANARNIGVTPAGGGFTDALAAGAQGYAQGASVGSALSGSAATLQKAGSMVSNYLGFGNNSKPTINSAGSSTIDASGLQNKLSAGF